MLGIRVHRIPRQLACRKGCVPAAAAPSRVVFIGLAFSTALAFPPQAAAQQIMTWRLVPDGVVSPGYEFTRIASVIPTSGGRLVVADDRNKEIIVTDTRGNLFHKIGASGSGPGEFAQLHGAGLVGDTVWVIDRSEKRISLFSLDGTLLRTIRHESRDIPTHVLQTRVLGTPNYPLESAIVNSPSRALLLSSRDGRDMDTVARLPGRYTDHFMIRRPSGGYTVGNQLFSDAALVVVVPGGKSVYVVERPSANSPHSAAFQIIALTASGETIWRNQFTYIPKAVERQRADSLRRATNERLTGYGHSAGDIRNAVFIPEYYPPTSDAFSGSDGALWLRREESGMNVEYWIIDRGGKQVASLTVPRKKKLVAATSSIVWAVETDEFDVPSIHRYRVTR